MQGEVHPSWSGGERGNLQEGGVYTPPPEELTETPTDQSHRPCFSCGQMGHFHHDCTFMEYDLTTAMSSRRQGLPRHPPPLLCKVYLGTRKLTALLDSGSSVSMVRSHLLPAGLPVVRWTTVVCLHHHAWQLPVVHIWLGYLGTFWQVDTVRVEALPYPLLLG